MPLFLFRDEDNVMKTSVQQSFHSYSATHMFAVHRLLTFPLNVITAKRHYRYIGITASYLPSHGITVKFPCPRGNYRG